MRSDILRMDSLSYKWQESAIFPTISQGEVCQMHKRKNVSTDVGNLPALSLSELSELPRSELENMVLAFQKTMHLKKQKGGLRK